MAQTAGTLPILTVRLNGSIDQLTSQALTTLNPLRSEFGQIVSVPHEFRLIGDGWMLTIPQTRFSSVDFNLGRIRGVEVNPHLEYLTLQQAANRLSEFEGKFESFGFSRDLQHSSTSANLMSREGTIQNDPNYAAEVYRGRRANVESSMVLKKGVPRGSPISGLANTNIDLFMLTLTVKTVRPQ
jgi:hypothetical protein